MVGKPKSEPLWFDIFDLEAEISELVARIEKATQFTLPEGKRKLVFEFAQRKFEDSKGDHVEARKAGNPVATSRRDFLTTVQETIFLAIPAENIELMPISDYVLNDPDFYEAAMLRAASITEDELFKAVSPIIEDMTVADARAFVSKIWHEGIDKNARRYAEALKRPEREPIPLRRRVRV